MNYDRALKTLHHARTGKMLDRKKLCNATWLHRVIDATVRENPPETNHLVDLVLFEKHILTWKPNSLAFNSRGYKTWTTKDRYARYLPREFRVWQERPFWYIATPSGNRPFRDGIELSLGGWDSDVPVTNQFDAYTMKTKVEEYAKRYTARLVGGALRGEGPDCPTCVSLAHTVNDPPDHVGPHLLEHIEREVTPSGLVLGAVNRMLHSARCFTTSGREMTRQFMRDVINASWFESQKVWRKARTKQALIEQTELLMTSDDLPRTDIRPHKHATNIRALLEDFLFEMLGYEPMED